MIIFLNPPHDTLFLFVCLFVFLDSLEIIMIKINVLYSSNNSPKPLLFWQEISYLDGTPVSHSKFRLLR